MPNAAGIVLNEAELLMLQSIGNAVWAHWFRPIASNDVKYGVGSESCGFLSAEIARFLREKTQGETDLRLVEFSGHDTNLLAFAALVSTFYARATNPHHNANSWRSFFCQIAFVFLVVCLQLGVDVPAPYFTGHWLIELHQNVDTNVWTVKVIYNADPTTMTDEEFMTLRPRKLPLDGKFVKIEDCAVGEMSADELIGYLDSASGFGKTAHELRGVVQALRTPKGKEHLEAFISADDGRGGEGYESQLSAWRIKELESAFEFIDANHSGGVSPDELHALFRRIGAHHITKDEVITIVELFDRESRFDGTADDQQVSISEFISMMAAMEQMAKHDKLKHLFIKNQTARKIADKSEGSVVSSFHGF